MKIFLKIIISTIAFTTISTSLLSPGARKEPSRQELEQIFKRVEAEKKKRLANDRKRLDPTTCKTKYRSKH
ncbi:hypothetical protein HN446_00320 [bacterium]|nr:hypothetical protein [bacterium]